MENTYWIKEKQRRVSEEEIKLAQLIYKLERVEAARQGILLSPDRAYAHISKLLIFSITRSQFTLSFLIKNKRCKSLNILGESFERRYEVSSLLQRPKTSSSKPVKSYSKTFSIMSVIITIHFFPWCALNKAIFIPKLVLTWIMLYNKFSLLLVVLMLQDTVIIFHCCGIFYLIRLCSFTCQIENFDGLVWKVCNRNKGWLLYNFV